MDSYNYMSIYTRGVPTKYMYLYQRHTYGYISYNYICIYTTDIPTIF